MNLQPSDLFFIAFVLWLGYKAFSGDGDDTTGGGRRARVPAS